ncbi:MAG: ATP-binding protein [Chloroflexota bacterium]
MNRTPFIGRQTETQLLQQLWASDRPELLILYGRRRIGKTRLLTHWLENIQVRSLYWVAEPTSAHDQLRSFSQALYNFANPHFPSPDEFSYASWQQAFQQLARLAEHERLVVIIDEFTYLLAVDPSLAGVLQNLWDHVLATTNLLLVISGSHVGMMERHLLSYQAPLFGRATALLKLFPLPFANTSQFFPAYKADERVALYAMLGGVPAYWERFDGKVSIDQNIRRQFLQTNNLLQDEPRLLLQDFVSEPHNYVAILRAIANGYRTPKEIATYTGLEEKHVPPYLTRLVETGFVERHIPITAPPSSRAGRHVIADPYLRFYFRFLARRQTQLALGVQDQALKEIKRHLLDFIGTHTWEELCQEWTLRAGAEMAIPFMPDQVGSFWNRKTDSPSVQIDVVGINSMEKTLVIGECKWSLKPIGRDVLNGLVDKTIAVVPKQGRWKVYYLGFARAGWTPEASQYALELRGSALADSNWQIEGMSLLNLDQVDHDLAAWTP